MAVSKALDVSFDWLFGKAETPRLVSDEGSELVRHQGLEPRTR